MSDRKITLERNDAIFEVRNCQFPGRFALDMALVFAVMGVGIYLNEQFLGGHWLITLWAAAISLIMFIALGNRQVKKVRGDWKRLTPQELRVWLDTKYPTGG